MNSIIKVLNFEPESQIQFLVANEETCSWGESFLRGHLLPVSGQFQEKE